ncbi:MAG: glycosyltransferase, partial [Nitrososphaeria archaeon]|nr:glycosyltransferase [Nitrososphaeria archaeon]
EYNFLVFVTCESNRFYVSKYHDITLVNIPAIQGKTTTIPVINDIMATLYLILKYRNKINIFYYVAGDGSISAILARIIGKKVIINPDGIEWKRPVKRAIYWPLHLKILSLPLMLLHLLFEYLSVHIANVIVCDSQEIKNRLEQVYKTKKAIYIPYGARELVSPSTSEEKEVEILSKYNLNSGTYYLTVARIVAENNLHIEIEGFKRVNTDKKLVIVGNFNYKDTYTKHLIKLKENNGNILLLNPIYDKETLGVLRKNCFAYIHGYEVGGTNPSLLEQMLYGRPILAYDVPFNREVLQEGGIYFKNEDDLAIKITKLEEGEFNLKLIKKMQITRIKMQYNWEKISNDYAHLFRTVIER